MAPESGGRLIVDRRRVSTALRLTVIAAWCLAGCGGRPAHGSGRVAAVLERCSATAAAGARLRLPTPEQTVTDLPAQPYAVATGAGWAFVTEPNGYRPGTGLISVLRIGPSGAALVRTVSVPGAPFGDRLTGGGRVLVVANYLGGLDALSTAALESGHGPVVLAQVPSTGRGDDEVVVDGADAFAPEEVSSDVAVYDLGRLAPAAGGVGQPHEVGSVPVGPAPSGIALDRRTSTVYVVSQGGGPAARSGELTAFAAAAAAADPSRAPTSSVPAGCDPVRVALSPDDELAWVTDRGADSLLVLRLERPAATTPARLAAAVRVGSDPVDVALVDGGSIALVTDSARYTHPHRDQTIAVVDANRALSGRPSLIGYLATGAFPRQFGHVQGGPLVVTDFDSLDVRVISAADLTWLGGHQGR